MEICREYGQPPSWFWGMGKEERTTVLADHQMRIQEAEQAAERAKRRRR